MLRYFLKRVLLFIPTIFVVSLIIFFLSKQSEASLIQNKIERTTKSKNIDLLQEWKIIQRERNNLGFNQPKFYWSIYRKSSSDTLNRIPDERIQQNLASLSYSIGNWEKVNHFWNEAKQLLIKVDPIEQKLIIEFFRNDFQQKFIFLKSKNVEQLNKRLQELRAEKTIRNNYLISISWKGPGNQYHEWITSLLIGDFGRSFLDGKSVNEKLYHAIKWTILLSSISIVLTLLIAIPLAFYVAFHPKSTLNIFLDKLFFAFYAMPNFWVATLLIIFLHQEIILVGSQLMDWVTLMIQVIGEKFFRSEARILFYPS
ncbi:MAG: hypothetical protein JKY48_05025 [Flavobacteriales bacterium]|nr:hypothetical protein [Flavobacteriales bacterium]